MTSDLKRFWAARELLLMLAWRDIRIKYKQSVMGMLWAVLMPSLIVAAGVLVRVGAGQYSGRPVTSGDIASVMVRAVIWSFVVAAIRFGTNSLTANSNLVSKIAFPKETFPIAAILSSGLDFLIAIAAVIVALVCVGWVPSIHALYFLPLLLIMAMMTTGLVLFLSAANLFFRDVKYLVEIFLTYAIFFTPVLYDAKMLGKWSQIIMINPIAPLLEATAATVVGHQNPDFGWTLYSAGFAVGIFFFGYWFFKQLEAKFAESI